MTLRIVIVEDDPMVAEINLAFMAELEGFDLVGTAHTGQEALELIRTHHPHLLLLDLFLPDLSGTELLRQAREMVPDIDAIMLTAAKEAPLVQNCIKMGVRDYLIKPYFKEQLHQALLNYRDYFHTARTCCGKLDQEQVDRILSKGPGHRPADRVGSPRQPEGLPKGLSRKTLMAIVTILETRRIISAEDVSADIGVSVVTARRYLNYLLESKRVDYELSYGSHGRPVHRYFLLAKKA